MKKKLFSAVLFFLVFACFAARLAFPEMTGHLTPSPSQGRR